MLLLDYVIGGDLWMKLYAPDFSSLLLCIMMQLFVSYFWSGLFENLLKCKDFFVAYAMGLIFHHALLLLLINAFIKSGASLNAASQISYFISFSASIFFFYKFKSFLHLKHITCVKPLEVVVVMLWCAFVTLLTCNIDFGKFHFPIMSSIINTDCVPGQINFPILKGQGYHYASNLWAAAVSSTYHIEPWTAERYLPLVLGWTPFVFFRHIGKQIIGKNCSSMIAWMAFFGTNLRLLFILLLQGLAVIFPDLYGGNDQQTLVNLITREQDLHTSIFFSSKTFLLLPGSYLGGPILYAFLALWINNQKVKESILVSLVLVCVLSLAREDYFLLCSFGLSILILVKHINVLKFFLISICLVVVIVLFQGGVLTEAFHAKKTDVELEGNTFSAGKAMALEGSYLPKLASLSIDRGRQKVSLFHPQIVLDLFLDLGIAIFGILWIYRWRKKMSSLLLLCSALFPYGAFVLFFDNPVFHYKLDLQRILPYNLTIFILLIPIFLQNWAWIKKIFIISICTGFLAGIVFPKKNLESFRWYDQDSLRLSQWITSHHDLKSKPVITVGINGGYVGSECYAYAEDFNLFKGHKLNEKLKKLYKNNQYEMIFNKGIDYIVINKNEFSFGEVVAKGKEKWLIRSPKN